MLSSSVSFRASNRHPIPSHRDCLRIILRLYDDEDPVEDVDGDEADGEEIATADVDPLSDLRRRHLDKRTREHGRTADRRAATLRLRCRLLHGRTRDVMRGLTGVTQERTQGPFST